MIYNNVLRHLASVVWQLPCSFRDVNNLAASEMARLVDAELSTQEINLDTASKQTKFKMNIY